MQLAAINPAEVEGFLAGALARFVDDLVAAGELGRADAEARTKALLAGILPRGAATPGPHFRRMRAGGAPVGFVWFAEQLGETPPRIYIYDIIVDDAARGRGHGTAALALVEEEARARGARQVMLSVFTHNEGAVRLYERLGYEPCERGGAGMRMAKPLP